MDSPVKKNGMSFFMTLSHKSNDFLLIKVCAQMRRIHSQLYDYITKALTTDLA
jgi:hypothetical protein